MSKLRAIPDDFMPASLTACVVVLILGFMYGYYQDPAGAVIGLAGSIALYFVGHEWVTRRELVKRTKNIRTVIDTFDVIAGGMRWTGQHCKMVFADEPEMIQSGHSEHFRWAFVMRTEAGAWCLLRIDTQGAKVVGADVVPLDDQQAGQIFSHVPELYHKFFGDPVAA